MNLNKGILVTFCALIYMFDCKAQMSPDSLIGTYIGEYWFKWEEDIEWTIQNDTLYVTNASEDCWMSAYGMIYHADGTQYETAYSFCNGNSTNCYSRFFSGDSIEIVYNDISQPPPNYHLFSTRYYGKKISSDIPTAIQSTKIDSKYTFYPNPFQNEINISFNNLQKRSIRLLNVNGKSVFYGEVATQNFIIPTTDLLTGFYLLQIISNNSIENFKLIKQ